MRFKDQEYALFYKLLGMLILLQVAMQFLSLNQKLSLISLETDESSLLSPIESNVHAKCMFCLDPIHYSTSTPCGHVFCWNCIADWIRQKPECPLCRQYTRPCELFLIH